jgi:hypothetical protein
MNARTKDDVFDLADRLEAKARQDRPFTEYERMRLELAARIAGGLCSNPHLYESHAWESTAAYSAMSIADKLLMLHMTGGC